jgi:predicted RNA polymerase sigma factor
MAKTAAERQAAYRAKRPYGGDDGNGERRLNLWLSTRADLAIERLARRYCVTKRQIIERLVIAEDDRVSATIDFDSPQWTEYFATASVTQ